MRCSECGAECSVGTWPQMDPESGRITYLVDPKGLPKYWRADPQTRNPAALFCSAGCSLKDNQKQAALVANGS